MKIGLGLMVLYPQSASLEPPLLRASVLEYVHIRNSSQLKECLGCSFQVLHPMSQGFDELVLPVHCLLYVIKSFHDILLPHQEACLLVLRLQFHASCLFGGRL